MFAPNCRIIVTATRANDSLWVEVVMFDALCGCRGIRFGTSDLNA